MNTAALRAASMAMLGACSLLVSSPAAAGAVSRQGFMLPAEGSVKIVVFRPDVHVGSLRVGGLDEPNADWTASARQNIQNAMQEQAGRMDTKLEFIDDLQGDHAELLTQYRGLFEAVASAMMQHVTLGDKLPTKTIQVAGPAGAKPKNVTALDWTLGEGTRQLQEATGADYAMFVFTHDAYGDAGRKVAQFLMAGIFGAYIPAGIHIGYAALVELKTGNIEWFNTDLAIGGDPRQPDGSQKRVSQLMASFPTRGARPAQIATH